ncbi:MAG: hypothetical protein KF841_06040 [Phycisphaerae bacterium]|nr:hypothetical protein [Phycisphaerae bacterium]
MFKKILTAYKELPPELRIVLAMAGLASPYGAFELLRAMFPGVSTRVLIFSVAGVLAGLAIIGFLGSKLFTMGKKRRANKLASDLSSQESGGPVSMDVRAAIKSNNEKFFTAIREMKKNLNVNVYDLPWYIVIGDSGCGKTKLINEGGLTFSTGKPEGYQLGTLNYNWWFTEDAIFVDMAGRLCNPQDDADHREWQAFLDTIAKGRKGFPINGALVCVSADHLLQDSPEKHEQDANTALERLRELQTRLGVTFATYLVVTKCDKILGFMQFFDRAERDISFRNQIFGWSKPGDFATLYDPEQFMGDFDGLYTRLNELRIRRLNDDVDEHELGMAYSFPEEFREIREPLQTYMRTLFPMIKQARVVKNLIFRGVYFTTATQQGSVILKHLAERLGNDAAQNIPTLEELYPKPRAHFIKDLFFRKVFREYGLVFRNEQDAAKHQKLARLLRGATVAVTFIVLATLIYGFTRFNGLIGDARTMVIAAQNDKGEALPPPVVVATKAETQAIDACVKLGKYRQSLIDNPWAARLLSLFWDSGQPQRDLQTIRTGLFEQAVLRPALERVEKALVSTKLGEYGDSKEHHERAEKFRRALVVYLKLLAYRDREGERPTLEQPDFESLFSLVKEKESDKGDVIGQVSWGVFMSELGQYITQYPRDENLNPSAILRGRGFDSYAAATAALETYRRYLMPLATLDENHPDRTVQKWMLVKKSCADIESAYSQILALSGREIGDRNDLETLRVEFSKQHGVLKAAFENCRWEETKGEFRQRGEPLKPLGVALSEMRDKEWIAVQKAFHQAFTGRDVSGDLLKSAGDEAVEGDVTAARSVVNSPDRIRVLAAIGRLASPSVGMADDDESLDKILKRGLSDISLLNTSNLKPETPFAELVRDVPSLYAAILAPIRAGGGADAEKMFGLELTEDANIVRSRLDDMNDTLEKLAKPDDGGMKREMFKACVDNIIDSGNAVFEVREQPVAIQLRGEQKEFWKPTELTQLLTRQAELIARARLTDAIKLTVASLKSSTDGEWGIGELVPGYEKPVKSPYVIAAPRPLEKSPSREAESRRPADRPASRRRFGRDSSGERPETPIETAVPTEDTTTDAIPLCATRGFLANIVSEINVLRRMLTDLSPNDYLPDGDEDLGKRCRDAINESEKKFFDTYFAKWKNSYDQATMKFTQQLKVQKDWGSIQTDIKSFRPGVKNELEGLIGWLFENVVWPEHKLRMTNDDSHFLRDARNRSWKDAQFIAAMTDAADRNSEKPWSELSGTLGRGWDAFAASVGEYPPLPDDYTNELLQPVKSLSWRIAEDTIQRKLDDLKFMRDLLGIVDGCRNAMDREVHAKLMAIQDGSGFGMATLPYAGPDFTAKPIDAGKFSLFLRAVRVASVSLEPLDRELPTYNTRNSFYFACRQWEQFLKSGERTAFGEPLGVSIKYDPNFKSNAHLNRRWIDASDLTEWKNSKPDTNPPNMFDVAQFMIGLSPDAEGGGEIVAVSVETGGAGTKAKWTWPTSSVAYSTARIQLHSSGQRSNVNVKDLSSADLGKVDRMLFSAMLEQIGKPEDTDRTEWSICLGWDLLRMYEKRSDSLSANAIRTLRPEDRIVGTMFILKLDRPLPLPIQCLRPISPGSGR